MAVTPGQSNDDCGLVKLVVEALYHEETLKALVKGPGAEEATAGRGGTEILLSLDVLAQSAQVPGVPAAGFPPLRPVRRSSRFGERSQLALFACGVK